MRSRRYTVDNDASFSTTTGGMTTTTLSATGQLAVTLPAKRTDHRRNRSIENAVYSYIRARRALGETSVNTNEIAMALNIQIKDVATAIAGLRDKGIRQLK